jgi:predicted DNA binding CopG/RHH family protein
MPSPAVGYMKTFKELPMAKTTIRVDDELMLAAKHRALDEGISLQELIDLALREYLKKPLEKRRKEARK